MRDVEHGRIAPGNAGARRLVAQHREVEADILADDHPACERLPELLEQLGEARRAGDVGVGDSMDPSGRGRDRDPGSTRVSIRGSPRTMGPRIATAPIWTMRSFATSSPVVSRSSTIAGRAASAVCSAGGGRRASRPPGAQPKGRGCRSTVVGPSHSAAAGTRPDATAGRTAGAAWLGRRRAAGIEHSRRSVEGMALDDGLVPLRPGRDEVDRDPGERFDAIEVGTGARGQIGA